MNKSFCSSEANIKCRLTCSLLFIILLLVQVSCRKFVKVDPPYNSLNSGNVYQNDATAAAVLTDIYASMAAQNNATSNALRTNDITSISLYTGLNADEISLYYITNANFLAFYRNDLNQTITSPVYWNPIYSQILAANNAIEGINASNSLTTSIKNQLIGEAKFIRAFCYFYLTNLYGDVPLILTTNWKINSSLPRVPKEKVYEQIIADLLESQGLLKGEYVKGDATTPYPTATAERVRPNKGAATALLSRAYLFNRDWADAESQASTVINNSLLYDTVSLNNVFIKNNKEAIWQLQPVGNTFYSNTGEGMLFVLPATGPNITTNPVFLDSNLVKSFELNDLRKTNWIKSVKPGNVTFYYPNKYKIGNVNTTTQEYPTILRLAEQYLIRAEARAQLNNISDGLSDLNVIRKRAGLPSLNISTKSSLLAAILNERRFELFTEWGHRWFDLKRTNSIDSVMNIATPLKGGTWSSYKSSYPIPQTDLDRNSNLIQNIGY